MSEPAIDSTAQVSHEQDGRVLSGVGVSADRLAETMDRHAPSSPEEPPAGGTPAIPAEGTAAPPAAEPVSRGRQRFSDLTREREEARAEAAAAKAEREAIARELAELKARPASEPAAPAAAAPPAKPEPTRPMPTEDDLVAGKYQTYAEFTRDLAKWELEQYQATQDPAATVREILAQERERERFTSTLNASQDRARKAYPDFDTHFKANGQIPLGRTKAESLERVAFIANHPQSEHIQYALLKDAALLQRLGQSDPYTFGVAIAGLVPPPAAARPAWTPPPSPHPTVGASSPTTPTPSAELAKKGDYEAYKAQRNRERGVISR
jgi:hypothetical protein